MNIQQFKTHIDELFGQLLIDFHENEEYGYNNVSSDDYRTIGYATNLTPEIVLQAAERKVDLIVTHHDAWDFVYGMKERCTELLKEHQIAHFYVHLPLDYAEFGTCNSLLRLLGANIVQQSQHINGDSCIGIGELEHPVFLTELAEMLNGVLEEKVFVQRNSNKVICRIGMVTGAGNSTNQLKEAMDRNCDVYITGEKTLYTVQYAKFINMNLIVGSHTFTEIFGVRSLVYRIKEQHPEIEILQLIEEHNEVMT